MGDGGARRGEDPQVQVHEAVPFNAAQSVRGSHSASVERLPAAFVASVSLSRFVERNVERYEILLVHVADAFAVRGY